MNRFSISTEPGFEDASGYHGEAERSFTPGSTLELREIVAEAQGKQIPLTVAGAGTGLTGASVPDGGWLISLARFRRLDIEQGRAFCGAGVTLQDLQDAAVKTGQFFGPNPTEYSASIGGIISTNAGGARSFCFGSVRHHVLGLETTFMDGQSNWLKRGQPLGFDAPVVRQPGTTKNSAGYFLKPGVDWVNLLSGSEGTLGIITEAELKLLPIAPAILSGIVFFPQDESTLDAVGQWRGIPRLRLLEYLDEPSIDLLRTLYSDIPREARSALIIEQDLDREDDEEVDRWLQRLEQNNALADDSWFGFSAQDRERFRAVRHALSTTVVDRARHNGFHKLGTDFAVPFERNRDLLYYYRAGAERDFAGKYVIFGHIGDANVHLNLMPDSAAQAEKGKELMLDFARHVVSLGGTVAAEHGIGKLKRDLFKLMYSAEEIDQMRSVKRRLDPQWLLGRDVIFDQPV